MSDYNWKLTKKGLNDLVGTGLISQIEVEQLIQKSHHRKPGTFDDNPVRFYLNKAKSIWVQSIHYYGGENFNQPYYFLAEIRMATSNSCFSRFMNKYNPTVSLPFTY